MLTAEQDATEAGMLGFFHTVERLKVSEAARLSVQGPTATDTDPS